MVFDISIVAAEYLLYFTFSVLLYHLGRRGEKELTVSGKLGGLVDWDVVGLQGFFHALDPGLPWSSSCLVS